MPQEQLGEQNFREKVANQYKARVLLKAQLQRWLYILLVLNLLLSIAKFATGKLNNIAPQPSVFDPYINLYLASFITPLLGLMSLKSNDVKKLTFSIVTNFLFSLGPIIVFLFLNFKTMDNLSFAVVSVVVGLHLLVLILSNKLRSSWLENKSKWTTFTIM